MKKLLCLVCMFAGFIYSNGQEVVNFKKLADSIGRSVPTGTSSKGMLKTVQPAPATINTSNQQSMPQQNQLRALETTPAPGKAFTGVIGTDNIIPLNPGVAANSSYIMEVTNQQYSIYNKQGGIVTSLYQSTFYGIASSAAGVFDPKILYETKLNRWLISTGLKGYGITLAVSQTSDPTGNWYIYHTAGIDSSIGFNDYPCMGFSDSLIVISCNDFINYYGKTTQADYTYNSYFVINKYNALNGVLKYTNVIDSNKFGLYPAQNFDGTDTVWNVGYMESYNGISYYYLSYFTGGAHPVYHAAKNYSYSIGGNYSLNDFVPQKGISNNIYTGDCRVQPTPSVRNGLLLFCNEMSGPTSGTPTYNYVQWLQIKPDNGNLVQQGQINDATGHTTYFFPSVTSDSKGNIMLGYNVTSTTNYISAAYSIHLSTDQAGFMSPVYIYAAGVSPYDVTLGASNRWGDNNMMAYDPSTDGFTGVFEISNDTNAAGQKIWTTNSYGDSRGAIFEYATNGSNTPVVTCTTPAGLETVNITAASATLIWPENTSATSFQCYYAKVGNVLGAVSETVHRGNVYDSIMLQNLPGSTKQAWSVQAVCSTNTSSLANTDTFTTLNPPAGCAAPTALQTVKITANSATLIWPNNANATSYTCYYNHVGGQLFSWATAIYRGSAYDTAVLTSLPSLTKQAWSVQATCGTTTSSLANTDTFTTLTSPCGNPAMAINSITATSGVVSLAGGTGATLTKLAYSTTGAAPWYSVAGNTISGLTICTKYYVYDYITCNSASYWFFLPETFTTLCTRADEVTTSIENIDSFTFNVYPNPAGDYTMIDFNPAAVGATLKVMDLNGRQVMDNMKLDNTPQRLQLSFLPAGVYLLSVESNEQRAVKLLVKTE